jgi:hypothetical protein
LQVVDDDGERLGSTEQRQQAANREGHGQRIDLASSGVDALQGDIQCAPLWCGQAALRAVRTLRDQLSKSGEGQPSVELCRCYG